MSLFESNVEDLQQGYSAEKKFPQPPFLQRSVSAPAIAEHVSEAIIPAFKYDSEEDLGINLSYQFPSRLNPRLPQAKKTGHEEGESAYAHLFSENNPKSLSLLGDPLNESSLPAGLISSLMNDSQPRTPLDLIQADFPATPSSIYSKHLLQTNDNRFEQDMQAAELKVASITEDNTFLNQSAVSTKAANSSNVNSTTDSLTALVNPPHTIPPLISNNTASAEDPLDQAAKSFQKLYVSSDLSSLGTSTPQSGLIAQYHPPLHSVSGPNSIPGNNYFQPGSPLPPGSGGAVNASSSNNGTGLSLLGNVPHSFQTPTDPAIPFPLNTAATASSTSGGGSGATIHNNSFLNSDSRINLPTSTSTALPAYSGILGSSGSVPASSASANGSSANAPPSLNTPSHNSNQNHQISNMNISNSHSNSQNPGMNMPQNLNNSNLNGMSMIPPLSIHPATLSNQQGLQQPQYYIPQIYLNANGQPIYYRPNVTAGQFPQDFMYPAMMDQNGMPLNASSLLTDPSQLHLQQQAQLSGFLPPFSISSLTGAPLQAAYWPSATDPNIQQAGIQMYQSSLQNMRVGMVDDPTRMLYQPNLAFSNGLNPMQQLALQGQVNRGLASANMNSSISYPMNPGMIPLNSPNSQMPGMIPRPLPSNAVVSQIDQSSFVSGSEENRNSNREQDQQKERRDSHSAPSQNISSSLVGNVNGRSTQSSSNGNHPSGSNRENRSGRGNTSTHANNGGAVRDSLVEEFRSTFGKSRQWNLKDLTNHIVAFCQDQHGSRFIQQKLEICSESEKQLVFDEIYTFAQTLMTDVFGNYVLQKLFEYGSKDQCEALAVLLKGQAVQLSMQMYGCRVVQKALEYVSCERLVELVAEFDNPQMLIRCVHDSNGNHVIQKCIEVVSKAAKDAESKEVMEFLSRKIQFIIDSFRGRVKELSSHPYGCRVVQRILEHCTDSQKVVILEELRGCCGELVQDCYGNYVIQFVMQHGWDIDRAVLIKEVQEHLLDFSQHKFASNVVEKCLQYASKKDRDEMIWTIINVTFDLNNPVDSKGHCVLESMVRDPYANYVVQKVIDVSDEKQRAAIMRYVKDNISQLRKYTYGKHIIVRLEKITNEKF